MRLKSPSSCSEGLQRNMRKLFILPENDNPYKDELTSARKSVNGTALVLPESELNVSYLEDNDVEVVITTGLSSLWYYVLKGMNIVPITLGDRARYYELSDIVIDCKNENPKQCFVSNEHSICSNPDFDFAEIADLIRKLEWDSEFFGFNVAFLSCMHLTDNIYRRIEKFIQSENIRLVEYLCNCHDARSVRVAEDRGFEFKDIRINFTHFLQEGHKIELPEGVAFGKAGEQHIEVLRGIAHGLYTDSRYYFDGHFELEKVIEFYRNWVEKSVRGQFDDECWCLFEKEDPVAFCTVRFGKDKSTIIGLVGIGQNSRGKGLGKKLLYSVFNMLYQQGMQYVTVVTQGRNYAAQNLYQSVGFRTKTTQLWYHKWR